MRLRQAVIAASDLDAVVDRLRSELGLGEPFSDPAVGYFGLRNAVFALGDTFLEVVSPAREGSSAGRLLERRGSDCCGYMAMFQVSELAAARERAAARGVREVFSVEVEDMSEVHLHPHDMHGAIVSLSQPVPPESWRWGGPGWEQRSHPRFRVAGIVLMSSDADAARARWQAVLGAPAGIAIGRDSRVPPRGITEITITGDETGRPAIDLGGVKIDFAVSAFF